MSRVFARRPRRLAAFAAGGALVCAALVAAWTVSPSATAAAAKSGDRSSPIKPVIVIIGENHTFDKVFATYQPPKGQSVRNLLSEGIVTATGAPGPNVGAALQRTATDTAADGYKVSPTRTGSYSTLPQPNTTYVTVLLAQLTYQQTLLNRVQAQAARFTDTAALFQALGGGWWNRTPGPEEQARRLRCRPPTHDEHIAQEVKTQQ